MANTLALLQSISRILLSKLKLSLTATCAMVSGFLKVKTTTESERLSQSLKIKYIVAGTKLPKGWVEMPLGGHHGANGYAMAVKNDKRKN